MMMSVLKDYERETRPLPGRLHALPLGAYSDPEIFELELERVFRRDWFAVCGQTSLPVRATTTRLLWRTSR
jgi:phenylpropionate dioxygenase-like ring-hydroxylating dioxygenase large terminal subunit